MSDLISRLQQRGNHGRYLSKQNYVPSMQAAYAKEGDLYHEAADRIEALEVQIAEADRLAVAHNDALIALEKFVDTSAEHHKPYEHPLSAYDRGQTALAAYHAARDLP